MKDIDISLSENVARQSAKEINELKKENRNVKDIQLSILQDVLGDVRDQRGFFKKLCVILCIFIFMLIIGFISLSVHNQKILKDISTENTELYLNFLQKADVQIDTSNITEKE